MCQLKCVCDAFKEDFYIECCYVGTCDAAIAINITLKGKSSNCYKQA